MDSSRNHRSGSRPDLKILLRRRMKSPRSLRPTRAGWCFFAITLGVGFAALNTGNNLLYLVVSLMLAFLVLSGVLSEAALRGIRIRRRLSPEVFAGRENSVTLLVRNEQKRTPAFAISIEDFGARERSQRKGRRDAPETRTRPAQAPRPMWTS